MIVFTAANESYRRMLGALLASLVQHNRNHLDILEVGILDNGLLPHTIKRIRKWAEHKGLAVKFVRVTDQMFREAFGADIHVPEAYPYYARLLGPHVLAPGAARALYLDADTLVTGDLLKAFEIDLRGNIVGCCEEPGIRQFDCPERGIRNHAALGLPGDAPYFNSGVLLIDVPRWVDARVSEQVLQITRDHHEHVHAWDQYGLNVVLHRKWLALSRDWNETESFRPGKTFVRHFAWKKPVVRDYDMADQELFFGYIDMSPWEGWRPKSPKSRIRRKVEEMFILLLANRHTGGAS